MEELNKFELSILERISIKYPLIKTHIPFLKVRSRENTGVGMYINLFYCNTTEKVLDLEVENSSLGSNETIEMEGLKYGLGFEVDVTDGKLQFIELVTYGEEWDGICSDNFKFSSI